MDLAGTAVAHEEGAGSSTGFTRNEQLSENGKGELIQRVCAPQGSTNPAFADKPKDRILNRMDPDHVHEVQLGGRCDR
ncbi:hypothetical protein AB0N06_23760 [Streptomyces sp. NPDC051020]|uniref:hypothetical protein n=1 Tax=Streptomyces sp. NPDC051020 TaxID=3155409 RepID=UPI00343B5E9D